LALRIRRDITLAILENIFNAAELFSRKNSLSITSTVVSRSALAEVEWGELLPNDPSPRKSPRLK
jgi:hypothetical protein